jgi:hypothetical protein
MTFPSLDKWEPTRNTLHLASKVLGVIRVASLEPMPNDLQYSVQIEPNGLSTGQLPIGKVTLDFVEGAVEVVPKGGAVSAFRLQEHTQSSLTYAILESLRNAGHKIEINYEKVSDETPFSLDIAAARDYAEIVDRMFTSFARFRARLVGSMTPIVLWPHHFDLSFIWFLTNKTNEHKDPHINFGFAPFSDGIPQPYIYAYRWPMPDGLADIPLPKPAKWHTQGWTGAQVDYADFSHERHSDAVVENVLTGIFETLTSVD